VRGGVGAGGAGSQNRAPEEVSGPPATGPDGPDLPGEPGGPGGGDGSGGPGEEPHAHDRSAIRAVRIAVPVIAVPLAVGSPFLAGRVTAGDPAPTDVGADAGFARDMQVHHAQAVEMSL